VASLVFGAGGLGHKAGGLRPHGPRLPAPVSPTPMPSRRSSLGTSTRLRAPTVILGFAEFGPFSLFSPTALSLFVR